MSLTEQQQAILAFERQRWQHAGAKDAAVRDLFGMTSTRYYQLLNELIDQAAALEQDPQLVWRLRRLRDQRAARRGRLRAAG